MTRSTSALAHTRRFNACERVRLAIVAVVQVAEYLDTIGDTGIAMRRLKEHGASIEYVDRGYQITFAKCAGFSTANLRGALEAWLRAARRELETLGAKL
jgi:hypothetical protein